MLDPHLFGYCHQSQTRPSHLNLVYINSIGFLRMGPVFFPVLRLFQGEYNTLSFPPDGLFTVGPQTHPTAESRESIDFMVEYQVFWGDTSIFILEIKTGPVRSSRG